MKSEKNKNLFEKFVFNLLSGNYNIIQNATDQFNSESEDDKEVLKSLNVCFLIMLAGKDHHQYNSARKYIDHKIKHGKHQHIAEFYLKGVEIVSKEMKSFIKKNTQIKDSLIQLNRINVEKSHQEEIIEHFWQIFFPEGNLLFKSDQRRKMVKQLKEKRKIEIKEHNANPINDPAKEMLFTSNALLTIPLNNFYLKNKNISETIKNHLTAIREENQKYWYDHPIPIGISSEMNEVIYGLKGLSHTLKFEKSRGNAQNKENLNCILSVSVTHDGLHNIAHEYLTDEIKRSNDIKDLNIFIFTEKDTTRLVEEVLIPIAKKYTDHTDEALQNLKDVIGVDGEYGRHYSFLKAITALWQVFIDNNIKGTFKIDLDQVFPNPELVEQSGFSAFEHFKSSLWGAKGRDTHGNNVDLSMIAGALVNEADIEKSLFYPDVPFPTDNQVNPDDYIFFSKLPQALSTEAEMMEKYNSENIDGENFVLSRIHVTGGTNGILISALRKYRPFTPSFIGRAEDQAYLMSVLFEQVRFLRYLHKAGLIMRHDKHSFAGDAIKAAESGKIIGDYIRILLFSHYAKILPWSVSRVKSELDPFTGCFVSNIPFTVVYLRLALKLCHLFENEENQNKASSLMIEGIPRLFKHISAMEKNTVEMQQQYIKESQGWHLYYDILDIAENKIIQNDPWMLSLKDKARHMILDTKIN